MLLVRMLSLWYMAEEGRVHAWKHGELKNRPVKPHVGFLLEHPTSTEEATQTFFSSSTWRTFAQEELMGETPCVINGRSTILGGNLDLWHLRDGRFGALEAKDAYSSVWPMELVAHVAGALRSWKGLRNREGLLASLVRVAPRTGEEKVGGLAKFNAEEWRLHLQRDHLPYRRDCRVCVERSTGKPHKRISHPSAYVLSIDTAGPFRHKAMGGYQYLLVACYRFPQLPGVKGEDEASKGDAAEESVAVPEDGGDWILDEEAPNPVDEREDLPTGDVCAAEGEVVDGKPEDKVDDVENLKELADPLKFSSMYIVRPMKTRKHAETLKAIQEAYIQLRSCGLPVNKLHADRAREYNTKMLEMWAASRDIDVSKTQGDDPPQNGVAERGVRYIKMRTRILMSQAKELSGLTDEVVRSLWPFAAETAAAQQQAEVWGQPSPSVARFGSKVFTKRKGYGQGGRTDLLPKWVEGVYLGPARAVPGGHLVLTDEGNLWYSTNIRQFPAPPEPEGGSEADSEAPGHPPARRVRGKSSIVELAGGVGLIPGFVRRDPGHDGGEVGLKAIAKLADAEASASSGEVVTSDFRLDSVEAVSGSSVKAEPSQTVEPLAATYLREKRFSMEDCLKVLEGEHFRKTRKQRATAWQDNQPPPIHTTLGAYQRGPWTGVTTATARHEALTKYLTAVLRHLCGDDMCFSSITVAKDLCTDTHKDRFNLKGSRNYVLTLGEFSGGGLWQEGSCEGMPTVTMQATSGEEKIGFVSSVRNQVVQVDPKKLHKTMPWSGGPKWTIIGHTVGQYRKLEEGQLQELGRLGFAVPPCSISGELRALEVQGGLNEEQEIRNGPAWFPAPTDVEGEMWTRMWTRRLLDEEELLAPTVPQQFKDVFEGVHTANQAAAASLDEREFLVCRDRYDVEEWLTLCRMTEAPDEVHGVEALLETLTGPLRVVYTVALDEVKQFISRWAASILKEAEALIKAGALVPLTVEEQRTLEMSGKLVVLPAKGVFTVKPSGSGR